jgi:hypothetical protein
MNPAHVRFAPKAPEMLHRREMTRWAINDQSALQQFWAAEGRRV